MGVPVLLAADGHRREALDGSIVTQTTPTTSPPATAASPTAWDPYVGYFQLSRFKFVEDASGAARWTSSSEQQILRVPNNRQECCHVAGDIDFDKHNNLWLVTGDDTPAGGINASGYGPFNDQLTDEQQTVRVTNATGGTFTLTFNGQTTAPLPFNATAAQVDAALEALSNVGANNVQTSGGPANTANVERVLPPRAAAVRPAADHHRRRRPDRHRRRRSRSPRRSEGGWYPAPDRRRPPLDAEHQRPARQDPAHQGQGRDIAPPTPTRPTSARRRRVHDPGRATCSRSSPAHRRPRPRPEVYAMGFRNPFRIQVDENDVAYISDYSPDANAPRAAAGRPASAASRSSASRPTTAIRSATRASSATTRWNFHEFAPGTDAPPAPAATRPAAADRLRRRRRSVNDSRWDLDGGPGNEPGLREMPAGHRSGDLVLLPRQQRGDPARHAVLRLLRDDPRADRARARRPSARGCSRSSTRAASARTAPRSTTTTRPTRTRRSSRRTTTTR